MAGTSKTRSGRSSRSVGDIVFDAIIILVMVTVVFVCLYPFFLAVVMSFNEGIDALRGGIYFWPRKPTLANYKQLLKDEAWMREFGVTLARTVLGTIITVFFTLLVSYGLSHQELIGRKYYYGFFIFAMYFSGGVIPYYVLLRTLHLLNTFWVYIVPGSLSLFYIMVSTSFFQQIPTEISESAKLDGAGEMTIFTQLILPLSKPIMATVSIFTAVGHWNAWYDSAFFATTNKEIRTVAYLMTTVINQQARNVQQNDVSMMNSAGNATTLSVQLAAMVVAVTPILCVYPFFQQYFVTGLTVGSVKS